MVFTVDGLNKLRDSIVTDWDWGAFGAPSSAITPSETDDYMNGEIERVARSSATSTIDKRADLEFLLSSVQGNGETLRAFGVFETDQTVLEDGEATADWSAAGDAAISADSSIYKVGSNSMKFAMTYSTGAGTGTKTTSIGDLSALTGVNSGTPTQGTITMWVYVDDVSDLNATDGIVYRVGSGASDYAEGKLQASSLTDATWYSWGIDLRNATITGTPDWTDVDYQLMTVNCTANVNAYFDSMLFNGPMGVYESLPALEKTNAKEVTVTLITEVDNE